MKKMFGLMCVVALTGLLAGSALAADFTLKLANAGPADPEDRTVIAVEIFKNHVETKTGGSVKVEVFPQIRRFVFPRQICDIAEGGRREVVSLRDLFQIFHSATRYLFELWIRKHKRGAGVAALIHKYEAVPGRESAPRFR